MSNWPALKYRDPQVECVPPSTLFYEMEEGKQKVVLAIINMRREMRIYDHLGNELEQIAREQERILSRVDELEIEITEAYETLLAISEKAGPVGAEAVDWQRLRWFEPNEAEVLGPDQFASESWKSLRHVLLNPHARDGRLTETCYACWRRGGMQCSVCDRPVCSLHTKRELGRPIDVTSVLCDWCDVVEGSELRLMRILRGRPLRDSERRSWSGNFNELQMEWRTKIEADAMFAAHCNVKYTRTSLVAVDPKDSGRPPP